MSSICGEWRVNASGYRSIKAWHSQCLRVDVSREGGGLCGVARWTRRKGIGGKATSRQRHIDTHTAWRAAHHLRRGVPSPIDVAGQGPEALGAALEATAECTQVGACWQATGHRVTLTRSWPRAPTPWRPPRCLGCAGVGIKSGWIEWVGGEERKYRRCVWSRRCLP